MNTVQDVEQAIRQLPKQDLAAVRAWFAAFDAEQWDRQFEDDVKAGRLDALAAEPPGAAAGLPNSGRVGVV